MGLERWISGEEHFLLLQTTGVWVLALRSGGSQFPVTPVPEIDPTPSSERIKDMRAYLYVDNDTDMDNLALAKMANARRVKGYETA